MKLSRIRIKGFQQFHELDLDLTYPAGHPKAGQALDKVCFIGRNGTGKSTLLRMVQQILTQAGNMFQTPGWAAFKFHTETEDGYLCCLPDSKVAHYPSSVEALDFFSAMDEFVASGQGLEQIITLQGDIPEAIWGVTNQVRQYKLQDNTGDLLIYSPSETPSNRYLEVRNVPSTNLSEALEFFQRQPCLHIVSNETSKEFWKLLTFQVKKRESDFQAFLKQEENRQKTVAEVEREFDSKHPLILEEIAALWDRILEAAGLEFDVENAKIPLQLTENLQAYIRVRGSHERVSYHALSTGIRNFIFRLGHIHLLYFQREIKRGFLLVDEPENSLYPDFLYELIQEYLGLVHNTQLFVATHHPIIAAQFEPSERIILDFDERGGVISYKGRSPVGDDPNDLLEDDFNVSSLYGKEGQESWERFLELQRSIPKETAPSKKQELLGEYLRLGSAYGFSVNRIGEQG